MYEKATIAVRGFYSGDFALTMSRDDKGLGYDAAKGKIKRSLSSLRTDRRKVNRRYCTMLALEDVSR